MGMLSGITFFSLVSRRGQNRRSSDVAGVVGLLALSDDCRLRNLEIASVAREARDRGFAGEAAQQGSVAVVAVDCGPAIPMTPKFPLRSAS